MISTLKLKKIKPVDSYLSLKSLNFLDSACYSMYLWNCLTDLNELNFSNQAKMKFQIFCYSSKKVFISSLAAWASSYHYNSLITL